MALNGFLNWLTIIVLGMFLAPFTQDLTYENGFMWAIFYSVGLSWPLLIGVTLVNIVVGLTAKKLKPKFMVLLILPILCTFAVMILFNTMQAPTGGWDNISWNIWSLRNYDVWTINLYLILGVGSSIFWSLRYRKRKNRVN